MAKKAKAKAPKRYVIYKHANRMHLGRVREEQDGKVLVLNENYCHVPHLRTTVEIQATQIVVELGSNPHPGKAYGVSLEGLYRKKVEINHLGEIHLFYKPKPETLKNIARAARITHKRLSKLHLEKLLDHDVYWELKPKVGKHAGMYKRTVRKENVTEFISFSVENYDASDYTYILCHELGHLLHFNYLKSEDKLDAQWLALYTRGTTQEIISAKVCEELMANVVEEENMPSQCARGLDDESKENLKQVLKQIKRLHNVGLKDMDLLWKGGKLDRIRKLWATVVPYSNSESILTDYARKNYEELFAEAFAMYVQGKKMPKEITKLMEKTISVIRHQIGK